MAKPRIAGQFLGRDPADSNSEWSEDHLQMFIVMQSHREGYVFAAGLEGVSKSRAAAGKASAMGMQAGETDLRYYFNGGRTIMIELKTSSGKLTASQKIRIPLLRSLGFNVCVLYADCPMAGWLGVKRIIECGILNEGEV